MMKIVKGVKIFMLLIMGKIFTWFDQDFNAHILEDEPEDPGYCPICLSELPNNNFAFCSLCGLLEGRV